MTIYLEVPAHLEWHSSSLCCPGNAAGGTTKQIYPEKEIMHCCNHLLQQQCKVKQLLRFMYTVTAV